MRLIGILLLCITVHAGATSMPHGGGTSRDIHPKTFVRNQGQWPAAVRYGILGSSAKAALTAEGVELFSLASAPRMPLETVQPGPGTAMGPAGGRPVFSRTRLRFLRPSPRLKIVEGEEAVTRMHFYPGHEKAGWHENVGTVRSLTYENVWENIDLEYRYDGERLRQSIRVRPGGDPRDIAFLVDGADAPETVLRPSGAGTLLDRKMPMEIRVDTLRPRPGPALRAWRQLVETEFCTFFGGKADEHSFGIIADEQSNIYLFMLTESSDMPVHNAIQTSLRGGSDHYLAGLSCDGNTLLFGTYFGSLLTDFDAPNPGYGWYHIPLHRSPGGDLLLSTFARGNDFPVTPGAVQSAPIDNPMTYDTRDYNSVLLRFRDDGRLRASTYLEGPIYSRITDIAVGPDDDVYVLGMATGEQWFVTPGVVHPWLSMRGYVDSQGCLSTAYVVRLSAALDTLRWGTYFFNSNGYNDSWFYPVNTPRPAVSMPEMDMEVDKQGCPVIVGIADTLSRLTATRQYGVPSVGVEAAWLARLAPDAKSYRHAVSLHGMGTPIGANALVLDAEDNAIVHGFTYGTGFPATIAPLLKRVNSNPWDSFIAKFDSTGNLVNAAIIGGEFDHGSFRGDISLSRCGEVVVMSELGFVSAMQTVEPRDLSRGMELWSEGRTVPSILICDSSLTHVSYSSPAHPDSDTDSWDYGNTWSDVDFLSFDPAGYVYRIFGWANSAALDPIIYNTSRTQETEIDVFFSRHHYPICQLLYCRLEVEDTLVVPDPPESLHPSGFRVTVTVTTDAATADANNVIGDLFLPDGVNTLAGDSVVHFSFEPGTMAPGTSISRSVMVRPTRAFRTDTLPYIFIGYYTDSRDERSCPRPLTVCTAHTYLHRVPEYRPLPECELVVHDSLIDYPATPRCAPGTVPVQLTLRHRGLAAWKIGKVVLRLPDGMGLAFAPPGDSLRGDRVLEPGDTLSWTWMVTLPLRNEATLAMIRVHVFDTTGMEITRCWDEAPIPEMPGLSCALTLPQTVTWDVAAGRALTDPIPASMLIDNRLDSSLGMVTVRIDLSRAAHLRLDAAEPLERRPGALGPCETATAPWQLHATEPIATYTTDTVTVWYRFDGDNTERFCSRQIQLFRLEKTITCSVTMPDTLGTLSGDDSRLDTLRVSAVLRNMGSAAVGLRDAMLAVSGADGWKAIDPMQRTLTVLAAGDSIQLFWKLIIPVSASARTLRCDLSIHDERGMQISQCGSAVYLPPFDLSPYCAVVLPDSIHASPETGGYQPNPIPVRVTVHNPDDAIATGIDASVILGDAPRLRLRAGEPSTRPIPAIAAHDSVELGWLLEVADSPETDSIQTVSIVLRQAELVLSSCAGTTVLQHMPAIAKLRCLAFGHDSAYYDAKYEIIVPDPLQVWYSISNEGTADAQACEVSLLLPPGWKFADGVTNPALFGTIVPGDTVARSWLITPVEGAPWSDAITLAFSGACGSDSIEGGCVHQIGLSTGNTRELVFTPLRMVFEAEEGGPLPPAQSAHVWTAGAAPLSWTATPTAPWLDAYPAMMQGAGSIDIRPNSTAYPAGMYHADVLLGTGQQAPRAIEVYYDITDGTMAVPPASAAAHGMQLYPNPYSISRHGMLHIVMTGSARQAEGGLLCSIHDLLGRELQRTVIDNAEIADGTVRIPFNARAARIGPVLVTIRGAREFASMLLLLTP